MKELSLHILDIAYNSLRAGASRVVIDISEAAGMVAVTVSDDGRGMPPELLTEVMDPFTTTRTTRRVGLGIPLFKMAAELAGGSLSIESAPDRGTTLTASFIEGHIDTPPLGDISSTMVTLVQSSPDVDFIYTHSAGQRNFGLDTENIRTQLGGVPLNEPDVLEWIEGYVREGEMQLTADI